MPLRITLKPFERLIINGASIRNGGRNADFLIETQCQFLRESEILHESEADTACKTLCVTLQVIHLSDDPSDAKALLMEQALRILAAVPSMAPHLLAIQTAVDEGQTHRAIKLGKALVAYERSLLDYVPSVSDVA
ncbi:flagellar protein FlbT [Methylobacterium sp. BTF04]|uniref:flagellar biosynthesis repressor FlbT n=1 Tax=Methylobacterium sp. BTF04 TaxID=2708300 RepID=UPI0013D04BC7|nr:flagellar biosynthesis repressor FlbT [Methylobacterium sp. BTF04]NEU14855.1 flagellar protein FlbT [Methylobacterium sp. BTF04]